MSHDLDLGDAIAGNARGGVSDAGAAELTVAPRRHYGRWAAGIAALWFVGFFVKALLESPNIDTATIRKYLFDPTVLSGLWHTIELTVVAMALGVVLGIALAAMRVSSNPVMKAIAWVWVWLFRSVPVLVQLIIWFNLALIFQRVSLGIPGTGVTFASWDTNSVITGFMAAVLGLGLAESAYYSEIVRGGLLGVDRGQREAAEALGLRKFQIFRMVVLPQAMRIIIPPTGNEIIGMLKMSSLASVIGYTDLAGSAAQIYGRNLKTMELLLVISFWYIVLTTVLSIGQYFLERHFGRGQGRQPQRSAAQTIRDGYRLRMRRKS